MKMSFLNVLIAIVIGSVFLAAVLCQSKRGEDAPTSPAHPALETFSFEGVPLSMSLEQFKKQKPTATCRECDEAHGLQRLQLFQPMPGYAASFYSVDVTLSKIEVLYDAAQVGFMGGKEAVLDHLLDQFGPADRDLDNTWAANGGRILTWKNPNREASVFIQNNGRVLLTVEDRRLFELYVLRMHGALKERLREQSGQTQDNTGIGQ